MFISRQEKHKLRDQNMTEGMGEWRRIEQKGEKGPKQIHTIKFRGKEKRKGVSDIQKTGISIIKQRTT